MHVEELWNTLVKHTVASVRKTSDFLDIPKARLGLELVTFFAPTIQESFVYKSFSINGINSKWVIPPVEAEGKVLMYCHGGGYATGSNHTHKPLLTQICKSAGVRGLLFEYRLAPEHPYPAAIEDAVEVYKHLLKEGYSPDSIALGGDSAGGGLSMATLYRLRSLGIPLPSCVILLSPWLDLTASSDSLLVNESHDAMINVEAMEYYIKNYAGDADVRNPEISPLFGDVKGLPPMYIQVCKNEVLLDDSLSFHQKCKEQNISCRLDVYGDLLHVWQAFWPVLPEARRANKELGLFVGKMLGVD